MLSTVWCCCSFTASTHHYSTFNSVIPCLFFFLSENDEKRHPHASFQMPAHILCVLYCLAYKTNKNKKRQLGIGEYFCIKSGLLEQVFALFSFSILCQICFCFTNCLTQQSASFYIIRDQGLFSRDSHICYDTSVISTNQKWFLKVTSHFLDLHFSVHGYIIWNQLLLKSSQNTTEWKFLINRHTHFCSV